MNRTARITQLLESIARKALGSLRPGIPADVRIVDVRRVRDVFIVATDNPSDRWARYYVETFRIPTPDNTDPAYDEGNARMVWSPLAGWGSDSSDDLVDMVAKATAYAHDQDIDLALI